MIKKLLFGFIAILLFQGVFAQCSGSDIPLNVSNIIQTNRFSTCGSTPTIYACLAGSTSPSTATAPGGVLTCANACDSVTINIQIQGIQWNQTPGINWLHGVFFSNASAGYTLTGTNLGPGWGPYNSCTGAACSAQIPGNLGYYYDGTTASSCCNPLTPNDGIPSNNWGVGTYNCGVPFQINFSYRLCLSLITGPSITIRLKGTADGGTGCWSTPDFTSHQILFNIATAACAPLVTTTTVTPITKTCTPTPDYTTTFTGGCSNGNTVTWWTQQIGGTQVGSGSPFVYHSTTCPGNLTLYASCCPTPNTCANRSPVTVNGCPPNIALDPPTVTQPTCTVSTGSIHVQATAGTASGTVTYTITPGGTSNTSGDFPGLSPNSYTITATDATGCSASASATINTATTGGPGPTVVSPVNYCVGAAAVPLTAPGTNDLWYTVPTGGVGSATAPTPSTATAGTTHYYVSQNPTGSCESVRSQIDVIVTANSTITLTSAAATNNQTVCVNTAITPITYSTGLGATGATVTGLPAGVTGVYSGGTNGTVTISGTPTVTGPFGYTINTSGGCGIASATGTITVSTAGTLTLTSAAATTAQTLCISTPITNITYSTGGGVTGATVTGLPAGVTGVYSGGTNGTVTISGSPTASGTFNYSVTTIGGCSPVTLNGTITVNPNVTLVLTSAATSTAQTICITNPIVTITYASGSGVTGATITGLPAGVSGTYSGGTNGTVTISGTPTVTGTFNYSVTTIGGCTPVNHTGSIIINTASTLTLTSAATTTSQTVCINIPITAIGYQTGGGATGATVTGLPAGVTGTYSGGTNGTVSISGTPTVAGPFNYTVTTTGGCGVATLSGTITVNPNVILTLTSAAATTGQTLCINTAITNITYSTANGATGATITGLPAGVTGVYSGGTNGTVTISGTPTVSGPFNYTVTTTGGCTTPSLNGTITVNPNVTLVLSSGAATANQTVNINTPITTITYTAGSGATGVTVTGPLPAGVTGTYAGGVFTISGTPTVSGTFPYSVTTTGGCSPVTLSGTINVNDLTGIILTSAAGTDAQTICINTPLINITYALTGGATGASITSGSLPAGVTGSYGGGTNGTFTISGTPTVAGPFNYTISSSGGVGTASISGSITVNPLVTLTLTSAAATTSQTLCINTVLTNITYSTGGGVTGATVSGLPTGVTGIYSGGTNGTVSISGTPTVSGPFNYTVSTSGGCGTPSLNGTITVNPNVTVTLTSAPATAAQTPCINTAITNITYSTANGATGATITGLPAGVTGIYSGGTNGTVTISGTPTVAGPFNYTVTTTGGCTTPSLNGTITVNPASTIVLTSAAATTSQTLCINTLLTNIVYTTGSGVTGATVTGLPAGVTGTYSGGTNGTVTIAGTPTVSGPFNYTVTTIGTCGTPALSGTITVNPAATITLTSIVPTTSQTICINNPIAAITYSTANGVTGATVTGLPAGVTGAYSGGTNGTVTINGTPTISGPFNYTVTTSGGCASASLGGTITINANVTITLTSTPATTSQNICVNSPLTSIIYSTANGVTGVTVGGLPSGVTGTYSGGTDGTFTINGSPTVAGGPFNYTVTTTGGCSTASLSGTITVKPAATMVLTSAPATATQTICINTPVTNIVYTTGGGATGTTVSGLPAGVTGIYAGNTFTISGTPTVSGSFTYNVISSGGCGTIGISGTITVSPNVTLTLTSASASPSACINTAITNIVFTAANGVTGITATGLPAGITGTLTGTTYTISGIPTVSGPFNYTLNTTGGCSTAMQSGTITVNPNATISLTSAVATTSQTICINTAITNIVYTTANGATGATVTGLPAGVTGAYSGGTNGTFTISGTATASGTFNYTVSTTGGCGTASLSGSTTVTPAATITLTSATATAAQSVCINTAINNIVYTTANGVTNVTVTGLPAGVTGVFAGTTFTISGTPTVSGPFSYTVSTVGGCASASLNGTITVNNNVTIVLTSAAATTSQTICINSPLTSIVYTTANGATGATVTGLPAGIIGTYSGGTNGTLTIHGSPTVAGGPFNYTVTTTGGCSSASLSGSITVNPAATISLTSAATTTSQSICINTLLTNIVYTTGSGATGATVTGLPAGVTGLYSGGTNGTVTISGIPTVAGTFNYTVTTTGGCGTASLSGTVTVRPNVTLALTSAAATNSQSVCINTAITNITYAVGNATGATVTGLPAGINGVYAGGVFTISGTPTVTGSFPYTVTTAGGCSTASLSGSITVKPNVTLALTSSSATTNQTICANTAIAAITYNAGSGATGVTVTGLPAGVTGIYAGGVFTISGTATASGLFNYTVTTTGGCSTASLTGSINVVAIPAAPTVVSPVNYCPNDAATPLSATGTNLLWYTAATGGTGSATAPTPSTTTPGTTNYYVSQTTSVGSCEGPRAQIVVNINNGLSVNIGPDVTICQGDSIHFTPVVVPPAISYAWRSITPNVPNSTIDSLNTLGTTVHPVDDAEYVLRAIAGGCSAEDTVKVNVRWLPIVDAGPNAAICLNDSTFLSATITHTTGTTGITYAWTPTDSLTTPTNSLTTWAHPATSTWYKLTATTTSAAGGYGCDFVVFDSVKVIVQPVIHAFAGNDTIAMSGVPHQLHGTGGVHYFWSSPTATINNPNSQNATAILTGDANFFLKVQDAIGCTGYDSLFVKLYNGPTFYVPSAFTPDGDGLNDILRPIPSGISNMTYFRVFNRYGELMFETTQYLKGWDGTFKGKAQPTGTYVWMVRGVDRNNQIVEMKGTSMIIR